MDVAFEFLLPRESKITNIKFSQPTFEWQGEKFPQSQEEAWFHHFKLIKSNVPEYIIELLPDDFRREQWQCIAIVDGIESLVNELSEDTNSPKENNMLLALLFSLTENEQKWVINFEPDYDRIDEVIEGDVNKTFRKIIDSLTVKENGFVVYCKRRSSEEIKLRQLFKRDSKLNCVNTFLKFISFFKNS